MFIYLYIFGLVVGGVVLGASLAFGGGDDGGADDAADGADELGEASLGGVDVFLGSFRSLRFWTFFLAFFGLAGVVLEGFGLVGSRYVTLALALGVGSFAGFGATEVMRRLAADDSGQVATSRDYIGKSARVVVPVRAGGVGKVRIQLKGTTIDLLAEAIDGEFDAREEALIIEMDGATARIARVDGIAAKSG